MRAAIENDALNLWKGLRRSTVEVMARRALHSLVKQYAVHPESDAATIIRAVRLIFPMEANKVPLDALADLLEVARTPRGGFDRAFHNLLTQAALPRGQDAEGTRQAMKAERLRRLRPRKRK